MSQPFKLLLALIFLWNADCFAGSGNSLVTKDSKYKLTIFAFKKPLDRRTTFNTQEPIALDIKIASRSKAQSIPTTIRSIVFRHTSGHDKMSSEPRVRALSDGTFFADNIIFPTGGNWEMSLELEGQLGREMLVVNIAAKDPPSVRKVAKFKPIAVPDFMLTDTQGKQVALSNLKGKVWAANFFFASCPNVCPLMNKRMAVFHKQFKSDPGFMIVSVTTDPKNDTPEILAKYAKRFDADPSRWYFLTGDKKTIVNLANKGFNMPITEDSVAHAPHFAVVDRSGNTQGLFDSEKTMELERLPVLVKSLLGSKN